MAEQTVSDEAWESAVASAGGDGAISTVGSLVMGGHDLEVGRAHLENRGRSSKQKRPALPAGHAVAGKHLQPTESANSGDLGAIGRRIRAEVGVGFVGLLLISTNLVMPGNGELPNVAAFLPTDAQKTFDDLPVRVRNPNSGLEAQVVDGDVWERGPELVMMDGSVVRAIFSSTPQGSALCSSGSLRTAQAVSASSPTANTQRPHSMSVPHLARDTQDGDPGGLRHAPEHATGSGEQLGATWASVQADCEPVSCPLQGDGIPHSCDLFCPGGGLWQPNSGVSPLEEAGGVKGNGDLSSGGVNLAQNWAHRAQSAPVLKSFNGATDLDMSKGRQKGGVGIEVGHMGNTYRVAREGVAPNLSNAGPSFRASFQCNGVRPGMLMESLELQSREELVLLGVQATQNKCLM